jgi:hypothetical protein
MQSAWTWSQVKDDTFDGLWEVRMPLRDETRTTVGRLSLWCANDGEYLLTDLQLIAKHLHPQLEKSLMQFEIEPLPAIAVNAEDLATAPLRPRLLIERSV